MPFEITIPRLGWSMDEGNFVAWLKKEGEFVKAGELLFTLENEKATQDVEAVDSGILFVPPDGPQPGAVVKVGQTIGLLLENKVAGIETIESASVRLQEQAGEPSLKMESVTPAILVRKPLNEGSEKNRVTASPRARRRAAALGIDLTNLKGSGCTGRIVETDILKAAGFTSNDCEPFVRSRMREGQAGSQIAITDWTFPDLGIEIDLLQNEGVELLSQQCKTTAELMALVCDADVVITQFAKIDAAVISAMTRARAIIRYGIGVDNVDLEVARSRRIPVCNIPDYCVDEVADHTLALILNITRQIVANTMHVHGGKWGLPVPVAAMQALKNLGVGLIGFGRIGREVVRRLLPFRCRVLVFDPAVPASELTQAGAEAATFEELLAQSDVVSLHCPSTAQTRRMFSADTFARMKPGATLINVSRGDLVDSTALVSALESGKIRAAALDVFDPEPIPKDHPILKFPNVILTPHVASVSPSAVKRLRESVIHIAIRALRGQPLLNIVNGV